MANDKTLRTWNVTPQKIEEAVQRIVAAADPLQVILFGSRARGDHRQDSDVDLAVILDASEEEVPKRLPPRTLRGLRMEVTLVAVSKAKFDAHRPWLNSLFHYIDQEGVTLYERKDYESAHPDAPYAGGRRRVDITVSAA